MNCTQHITYHVNGKAYPEHLILPVTPEADEPHHLESGVINLYPELCYQTIDGFGGAMTDTASYLLGKMTPETREALLREFFTKEGNGFSLIRIPLDSCDYSVEPYQAVADPIADPELLTFSMERNFKNILPAVKEAIALCDLEVSVLVSPWSPPAQWKTPPARPKNDASVYGAFPGMREKKIDYDTPSRNNGGSLKKEYYGPWAKYLTKMIEAYLAEGVPVTMMTLQNESIAATGWDSCVWTAADQKEFLRDHMVPAMKEAGLFGKVGIYIWDHNKERVYEWAREVIDDETREMIEGIAFHWYSGDHFETLSMTQDRWPGLKMMMSEMCPLHKPGQVGFMGMFSKKTPETVEYDDAANYAHDIIGNLNHGMERWIDWNLCVNQDGGPSHAGSGFTASVIANEDGSYRKDLIFDYVGHFSKYIRRGAQRIGVSCCDQKVELTAAKNPDGSIALVILNSGTEDQGYAIRICDQVIRISAPVGTISTLMIEE